ncbi:hypothetical protein [Negadavirga shengliensis]|uniref:PepSY domain-containing protein n=1 Tax=Negadavirga shengliensis TaxID=1389218 RepID=A0ABV9SVB3_9BACT
MKKDKSKIPAKILGYLKDTFEPGFLFELLGTSSVNGQKVYDIEVYLDNTILKLRFNENGRVLERESRDAFPPDTPDI